jgi:hypothetical protein
MKQNTLLSKTIILILLCSHNISWDYIPKPIIEFNIQGGSSSSGNPVIAKLTNDNYVITSVGSNNIYFTIYDPNGTLVKAATQVSDTTMINIRSWVVADKAGGGFIVSWNNRDAGPACCSVDDLYVRYFDSTYTAGGPSIKINTTAPDYGSAQLYPTMSFVTGNNYFVGFNPTYGGVIMATGQMISLTNKTLALVGSTNTALGKNVPKLDYGLVSVGLGNGTFALAYHSTETGDHDMYLSIINSDFTFVSGKSYMRLNTNTPGLQVDGTIDLLTNKTFVVTWWDQNVSSGGDIMAQIVDQGGNFVGINFKVNNVAGSCTYPMVKSVGDDGFIIVYKSGSTTVYYQLFDISGKKVGGERKVNTMSGNLVGFPSVDAKVGDNLLVAYAMNTLNYGQYYYKDTNDCKDSTLTLGMDATTKQVQFSLGTNPHSWVYITTMPTKGSLKTTAGTVLTANTKFSITDVNYVYTTLNADSFKYSTNTVDASCTVTITPCYTSCFSCTTAGTSTSHQCTVCDSTNARGGGSFYPLEDNSAMCYQVSDNPAGYFFSTNIWKKCYTNCKYCTAYPTDPTVDMLCTTCATNFYPKADSMTNCVSGTVPGYYFDGTKYQKCYASCQNCTTTPPDVTNHQCIICLTGYFPKIDMKSSCYKQGSTVNGYYFDGTQYFQPCYTTCNTCTVAGTSTDNQCTTCKANYYSKATKSTDCFMSPLDLYYLDSNNVFQPCYTTCMTCSGPLSGSDQQCKTCIANYYPKADMMTSCFTGDQPQYFLVNQVYQKCYSTCNTCTTLGTATDNQCMTCKATYYPKVDNMTNCFTDPTDNYYLDKIVFKKCYVSCLYCTTMGTDTDHQCTKCVANYYPQDDKKTNCLTGTVPGFNFDPSTSTYKRCYTTCKTCTATLPTDTNHQCLTCLDTYYNKVDNMTSCFKSPIDLYYLDSSNIFQKCYKLCKTCSKAGTDTDNQCTICIQNYYHKTDDSSNCFTGALDYYFFDTSIYKNCFLSCQTCSKLGTTEDHFCGKCKTNYYPKIDHMTSCFTGNIDYYYLDKNLYYNCYSRCLTCTTAGTNADNKCITCAKGYKLTTGTNNCEATGEPLDGYYYNATTKSYQGCYPNCNTCSGPGTTDQMNCNTCNVNLYLVDGDKNGQCYPSDKIIQFYYFDQNVNRFLPCYKSCESCSAGGTDAKHNCIVCKKDYAPLINDNTMCYNIMDDINGYYYDEGTDIFKQCYKSCDRCTVGGDGTNHNCISCIDDTYTSEGNIGFCYSKDSYVSGQYFDEDAEMFKNCYITCAECKGPGTAKDPNCTECLDSQTDCSGCKDIVYKDSCVKECPAKTIYDTMNMECLDCKANQIFFNNMCLDNCDKGFIKQDNTCISCQANNKLLYKNSCVDSCPKDTETIIADNMCKEINSGNSTDINPLNNTTSVDNAPKSFTNQCGEDTCQNGGTCTMRFQLIFCSCQNGYTGIYCQLNTADDMSEYLS